MSDEKNLIPEDDSMENDANALTEGDIIEMIDDDAIEYENDVYLALAEPEEDDAVFFLKVEQDEDGNDVYTAPDEALEDILFSRFTELRSQDE